MVKVTKEGASRVYQTVSRPYISPLQLFVLILSMIYDILNANGIWDIVIAISITIALIFTGLSRSEAKELLLRIKTIFQDPKKTLQEKIAGVFDVVISGCATLGLLHEEALKYPIDDFIQKKEED